MSSVFNTRMELRLTKGMHSALRDIARKRGLRPSEYVRKLITDDMTQAIMDGAFNRFDEGDGNA